MAFPKQKEINFFTILVTSWLLVAPATATINIDCRGKAFHCVNSTHFKICVDFGGVSKTVDDFLIPCPQSTVCTENNYFECEYEITSAPIITEQSDVTNKPFPVTTQIFWDNFNVTTTNNDEQRIDLSTSSTTTSRSQLAFTLPVTEKLKRITYTPTHKLHEDIIRDSTERLSNKTFNYTREIENNFKPSPATSKETTITYNKLSNFRLAADINYETDVKSIETSTPASTKYSERLLSKFGVNIPLDSMHRYAGEINNTPISQIIGTPSTIVTLSEAQSDISHFTGSTDSYIEKMSQNMKTSDFNIPVTPTENDTPHDLLVSNKNIIESNTNGITLALSENLISTTETNIESLYSLTTVNKPSSNVENEIKILQNNDLSLPVITETSSTTNIDDKNVLYTSISHLTTSTDLNTEYMQFGELIRQNMSTTSNEFYAGASKTDSINKINVTSLLARNLNKMNDTLLTEVNETLMLATEPYNDNIPFMTTENKSFKNIEKDLTILQNKSIPDSVNMVFFKDVATETPSSILNSTNLIHSYIDVTDQDTKLKDKNLPITLTSDVYEFYTEKDGVNKNNQSVSMFEKRARKNTIDVTTSPTLSENLISTLATNKNKKPISIALNISVTKMPNEAAITKNNNISLSVMSESFTIKNLVTNEPSDISSITSIVNLYTENTTEIMKVRDENFSMTPITHIYDLLTNNKKMTSYNMTKDLSFNKNGTDVFANTTNIDFKTPVIYESTVLVTDAVNENKNITVNKLSQHKDIDLSSPMMKNYTTKVQQIAESILMDTSLYSTESYVLNREQSHTRDYTMNVQYSLNATESVTFPSTTTNLLEKKVTESTINSHDPLIINGKDIGHVEQNKNSYYSLTQESHNNISFTAPPINRTLINIDNISQKNENISEYITNIFGNLSTTSTVDYTQSTEYKISPTWNIVNNTGLELLIRNNNVNNKYTVAKLEIQKTTKNTCLDNINSAGLLKTETEASTSITEVDTPGTFVTVGKLSTPPMRTRSKNIVQMLMPNLNNDPNVNDIERVLKTDRINTTSVPKAAGIIGKHIYKNDSPSIRSLPTSDSNKLFKTQTINLFSYRSSNISVPEVEQAAGYLVTQSIKTDKGISTNGFDLPVTTEKNSDKLTEKIDHFVTKSDSYRSSANFKLEYIENTSPNIGSTNQMNMNAQISKTYGKLTNYTARESSNMNSDNLENISQHEESLTVLSNHDINKNITHSKLYSDAMIPQVFDKNKLFNEKSKDSNSSRNINKLELLDYGQEVKDSLALNTQVESYSSLAITTRPLKSTENTDRLDKLKYMEIEKKRDQNSRSNFINETKLSAETYMNPGNYSIINLTSIPEIHNSSNYHKIIIKCRDKDTREGCSRKGEDFTKLSRTNNNVTRNFKGSPFVFNCDNRHRGKYSDKNDCETFYLCLGKGLPIFGKCPNNTVFSEILKQCTKNLSHCVRGNKFQCKSPGRYIDVISNQFYYICVKKGHRYIRFKLQCQKGYRLNSSQVKCVLDAQEGSSSYEDSFNIERKRKTLFSESEEDINSNNKEKIFECLDEGKFTYPENCRKYYECKRVKSGFRRKIKKCDSNEVFDDDMKKCVNDDSFECN